jgi:hypothetical protein
MAGVMKHRHQLSPDGSDVQSEDLFAVYGRPHRRLATVALAVILSDVATHHIYLIQHPDGRIGPPDSEQFDRMIDAGHITRIENIPQDDCGVARMEIELALLDGAGVRNGEKAIWLHLNAVWGEDLRRRYGPFDDPATIRRWRTAHRKAAKTARRMERSDA